MLAVELIMIAIGLGAVIFSFRVSGEPSETNADSTPVRSEDSKQVREEMEQYKEELINSASEELSRIFTRGFVGRGEDPGRAGLGLFTARAYCTLLGHSLSVTSAEGKGTRAVIRVACTDAP